jgi:hypothetical protein
MRAIDVLECEAMGHSPKQALRLGLQSPGEAWTAKVDGRPEAMFGLNVESALGGIAHPWMLGSDAIYQHPREMIRWGEGLVRRWVDSYGALSNLVSVQNAPAIRMLRRWGFDIGTEIVERAGVSFVEFSMER